MSRSTKILDLGEDEVDGCEAPSVVYRSVKDPIHDYITLFPRSWAFVDTRQFQRLRSIKQLGTSYYVWPGASHNRFEHSLGVAFLARMQAQHLHDNQPELGITRRDVECVELAGLCHDLGHGPWSHIWDGHFVPLALKDKTWKHEDASEMMFDYLRRENGIRMKEEDARFVKALIVGDPERCDKSEKSFLFEIVANKRNGLDVDRFDYIARDSHAIGEKINISSTRLIRSARVIDDQICYDIKDANQIYEIFYMRFSLHKRIYNHKTAAAIEYMLVDALLAAEPYLQLAGQIEKPEKYTYLTDEVMGMIERSQEPELAKSRAIFDRIRSRDLYKLVDYKILEVGSLDVCSEHVTPQRIVEAAKDVGGVEGLGEGDVIVELHTIHYGMGERNPLEEVRFYSKRCQNRCAPANQGDISTLMPAVFAEVLLRVYTRQAKYFGKIQAGYRQVMGSLPDGPYATGHRGRLSPYRENSFTTVPVDYAPVALEARLKSRAEVGSSGKKAVG